jgi:hypothetical protein
MVTMIWRCNGDSSQTLSRTGLIGGANEIHGVEVPILEIHLVDIVTARAIEDTTDFGPDRSHGAHPAGLQRRIEHGIRQFASNFGAAFSTEVGR